MSDIKDVVEKQYILPGFAVTSFSSAVTAAAAADGAPAAKKPKLDATAAAAGSTATTTVQRTKFCIVQPFFESWPNLTRIYAQMEETTKTILNGAMSKQLYWMNNVCSIAVTSNSSYVVRPHLAADPSADPSAAAAAAAADTSVLKHVLDASRFILVDFIWPSPPNAHVDYDSDEEYDEDGEYGDEVHEEEEGDR
eukprot:GHVS01061506.1.p1 GENE.GHVS01061506.1~~GHVS01061506.1.p1  ORF type:complete len:195 (-),score=50.30 GHVS01061506.1:324-908(-)